MPNPPIDSIHIRMAKLIIAFRPPEADASQLGGNKRQNHARPFLLIKSQPKADDSEIARHRGSVSRHDFYLFPIHAQTLAACFQVVELFCRLSPGGAGHLPRRPGRLSRPLFRHPLTRNPPPDEQGEGCPMESGRASPAVRIRARNPPQGKEKALRETKGRETL